MLRLVYSRGRESGSTADGVRDIGAVPARVADARKRGVAAVTLARGLSAEGTTEMPWLLAGAKTLSYAVNMAALRHAERHGAGDVIFVGSDGLILEGPRSTVVIATELGRHSGAADSAAVVSDPSRNHAAGAVRSGPQQRLRLRLPGAAALLICLQRKVFGSYRASRSPRGCTPWTERRCSPPRWRLKSPNSSTPRSSAIAER